MLMRKMHVARSGLEHIADSTGFADILRPHLFLFRIVARPIKQLKLEGSRSRIHAQCQPITLEERQGVALIMKGDGRDIGIEISKDFLGLDLSAAPGRRYLVEVWQEALVGGLLVK